MADSAKARWRDWRKYVGENGENYIDANRWQYQHKAYCAALREAGVVQSMSRKGNCIDNGATEQLFGHMKDEFFRGQRFESFEEFKEKLEEYIVHWNTRRQQVRLKGLTPEEFRNQSQCAA